MTHKENGGEGIYTSYVQVFRRGIYGSSLPVRVLSSDTTDVSCVLTVYSGQSYPISMDA